MSYSEHFRRKILAKLEEGYSIRAVAAQFEINKNTIVEWKKRIEIKKTRVRKPSKINDDALREDVEKYPDAYQYERAARFNCGVSSIMSSPRLICVLKLHFLTGYLIFSIAIGIKWHCEG
ncbi:IS630 transposase-related protein [Acinetobacter johnsonii]